MRKAIYAGSFRPFTCAHENILQKALKIFDHIVLVMAQNPEKPPLTEECEALKKKLVQRKYSCEVILWKGLLADCARKHGITTLVRGVRPFGDFGYEMQMASFHKRISPELETLFIPSDKEFWDVSATLVRDVESHGFKDPTLTCKELP